MRMTKMLAGLMAAGALVTAPQIAEAQTTRLTSQESQYVNLLDDEEFQKADFYVQQGLVDPTNLSTGKTLVYYLFPGPDCDGPREGYCGPTLKVINGIAPHFDFNEPLRDGKRPATYICWGRQGALLTSQYAVENGWELDFHDDDGLQPFPYCANQRPYEPDNERNFSDRMALRDQVTVGDMQAGVSFTRGDGQLSLSYIRREVEYKERGIRGEETEDFAGVSFTLRR